MPTIATEPIVKEVQIAAQPDTVFAFFTEADKITRWLAAEAATDPRPGGIYHQTHRVEGVDYLLRGEFVEVDPPHRVVFTWGFENTEIGVVPGISTVEVTLTPADGGTHLRLVHSGLPEAAVAGHDSGWDEQLNNLRRAIAPAPAEIVSAEEWHAARDALLVKEKRLTRARDALAAERRRMPRLAVDKDYAFDGPAGRVSLPDLFEGRSQLIVYRFFFEPGVAGWPEHGCPGCSMVADQVAHLAHLNARDTTLAFVSRAPQADIERWKARMGWEIPWYTLTDDFDADHGVAEWHGTNAFLHEGGRVFRTYFIDGRGDEAMGSTWSYLDITALGRQEEWEDSPEGHPQTPPYTWWNLHDEYDTQKP